MRLKTEYDYDKGKTHNQYEPFDYMEETVDARYRPASAEGDRGNPLIEALPPVRTREEIIQAYSVSVPGFFSTNFTGKNAVECLDSMSFLRTARLELPYHEDVEMAIHNVLTTSYRNRSLRKFKVPFSASDGNLVEEEILLTSNDLDTKDIAVRILGSPGTGKSACIDIAKGRYPIAINHQLGDVQFTQIPLLYVVCPPNSNFKALFRGIARQVDRTLGYAKPFYEEPFANNKLSVDEMAQKICDLIEAFAIGAIVLDEIQLLNLASQTAGTDNALLKIINTTCVGLISVGTKDALDRLNSELHLARRLGKLIDTDTYCESRDYFEVIIRWISTYQWTKKKTLLTDEMKQLLYEETGGIIDMVVSIWMCIQTELIAGGNRGGITLKLIKQVSEKYYPGIRPVIEGLKENDKERRAQYAHMRMSADKIAEELQAKIKSEKKEAELLESFSEEELKKREIKKDQAVFLVKSCLSLEKLNISEKKIRECISSLMATDELMDADEKTIATEALETLRSGSPAGKQKKRSRAKAGSGSDLIVTESLRESIGGKNAKVM